MNPNDTLPVMMPVAGALLQFVVRQFKAMPEWSYHLIAFGLAFMVYGLITEKPFAEGTRQGILALVLWMAAHLPAIWGGTFVTSNAAKVVAGNHPGQKGSNMLLPMTDSK